jgi:serine/threonine-protein kinase RsbW
MKAEAFVTVKNDLSELERLNDSLSRFSTENLEEVFVNVVMHGFRDSAEHEIVVGMAVEDGAFVLSVEDDGVAFNPLEIPPVDTSVPIEMRRVGGLGMHLVRSVMSEMEYARRDGHNRLRMKRHIPRDK